MSWAAVIRDLAGVRAPRASSTASGFNPRPPGSIVPGGTTDAVLTWLQQRAGVPYPLKRIASAVDRPSHTVSWALHQLRTRGLICRRLVEPSRAVWWAPRHLDDRADAEASTDPSMARSPGIARAAEAARQEPPNEREAERDPAA